MKRNRVRVLLLLIITTVVYAACHKTDEFFSQMKTGNASAIFFDSRPVAPPIVEAFKGYMKGQNSRREFIPDLLSKYGIPYWDKAMLKGTANNNFTGRTSADSTITLYVPLVQSGENFVDAQLTIKASHADTSYSILAAGDYADFGFLTTADSSMNGLKVFSLFANHEKNVFGRTRFRILDNRILLGQTTLSLDTTKQYVLELDTTQSNGQSLMAAPIPPPPPNPSCLLVYQMMLSGYHVTYTMVGDVCIITSYTLDGTGGEPTGTGGGGGNGDPGWTGDNTGSGIDPNEPIDSMLARYTSAIKDTSAYIFNNLSMPANIEYAFTGIWENNQIKVIERTTNNDSLQVIPKVMIGNRILLFTWHSHISRSLDPAQRGSFSPDDIEMLRNVRCLTNRFTSFVDCGNKRYALVITDVTKATAFFNNNDYNTIFANHTSPNIGTVQEQDEQSVLHVIGSAAQNGISFYVSTDQPNFKTWTILNP